MLCRVLLSRAVPFLRPKNASPILRATSTKATRPLYGSDSSSSEGCRRYMSSSSSSSSSTTSGDDENSGGGGSGGKGGEDGWTWGWTPPKNQQLVEMANIAGDKLYEEELAADSSGGGSGGGGGIRWPIPGADEADAATTTRTATRGKVGYGYGGAGALPPVVRGARFTLEEVRSALEAMGAEDVQSIDATYPAPHSSFSSPSSPDTGGASGGGLYGEGDSDGSNGSASDGAVVYRFGEGVTHMVVGTGRMGGHLRRMADTLVSGLKQRRLAKKHKLRKLQQQWQHEGQGGQGRHGEFDYGNYDGEGVLGATGAEGYDCDDWIVVDMGNLMVHLVDAPTRAALQLEEHWRDPERLLPLTSTALAHKQHKQQQQQQRSSSSSFDEDELQSSLPSFSSPRAKRRAAAGGVGAMSGAAAARLLEERIDELVAANPVPEDYNV